MGALNFAREPVTVLSSAARTSTHQSNAFDTGNLDSIAVFVDVTAVSGTTPSMTVNVEWSHNGTDWHSADSADAFTAITTASKKVKRFDVKGTKFRLNNTVSGTSPSFTFSATVVKGA
jgi:hypothetical protein